MKPLHKKTSNSYCSQFWDRPHWLIDRLVANLVHLFCPLKSVLASFSLMHARILLLLWITISDFGLSVAQTVSAPRGPEVSEQSVAKYKIAIKIPKSWASASPSHNEILAYTGEIEGIRSTCLIRITTIAELVKAKPQDFVNAVTREKFLESASIAGPRPEVHIFDSALLGGVVARRIFHTQQHGDEFLTFITHQALRGADIVTVACYAKQSDFARVAGTFGMLIGTTRFLP